MRGQALILAVLAVIVVIALAALFVAVVAANLAHTSRQSDVVELRQIAEAGVRYASDQLSHSVEGADWRPTAIQINTPGNWKPVFNYGHGSFELIVTYAPASGDPLSRFISIRSIASLIRYYDPTGGGVYQPDPGNRYENALVQHTLVAYKPILITDYLQFITNASQTGQPAEFGVNNIEIPAATSDKSTVGPYTLGLLGPVRVNTDLVWRGTTDISLTISDPTYLRDDKVEVAGQISQPGAGVQLRSSADGGITWSVPASLAASFPYNLFTTVTGLYRDGVQAYTLPAVDPGPAAPYPRYVRYEAAPNLDLGDTYTTTHGRYRSLTRFSGAYLPAALPPRYLGEWGTGDGVYVDNATDLEYGGHDYITQRNGWTDPTFNVGGVDYWNAEPASDTWHPTRGRLYAPPGCEIVLHPALQYGLNVPYIEIIRHDDANPWSYWNGAAVAPLPSRLYPDGVTVLPANTLVLPFPMDGVIFAEGSVRIRGDLPPATNPPPPVYFGNSVAYNLSNIADPNTLGGWSGDNRYYDLTVVSNGNIYVDGPLRTPNTANPGSPVLEQRNTKIALLARDSVVLNTTQVWSYRLRRDPTDSQGTPTGRNCWHVTSADPLVFKFNINGAVPAGTRLFLRHAGYTGGAGGDPPAPDDLTKQAAVTLTINGIPYVWNDGGSGSTTYYFTQAAFAYPLGQPNRSNHWYDRSTDTGFEWLPDASPGSALQPMDLTVSPYLKQGENTITFTVSGMYDCVVAQVEILPPQDIAVPANTMLVPVEALMYAQNGAGFVLPGPWFNDITDSTYAPPNYWVNGPGDTPAGFSYPTFHEPVNARLALLGALSANQTAAVGDVRDYTSKWYGPTGATNPPFLTYLYDPKIRTFRYEGLQTVPRLPKLPVCEQLIIWGEQY